MDILPLADVFSSDRQRGECKGTYAFMSLGCPKNLVDSERMLGLLQLDGYQLVSEADGADFAIVNTCGFIESAREESFGVIEEMLKLKQAGRIRGLIVSGCLAEREKEALRKAQPEIDHIVGVFARDEVTQLADRLIGTLKEQQSIFHPAPARPLSDMGRLRITPPHLAYLKISEGCDRLCTFCTIPKLRGKHASKPIDEIVREAEALVADGVRELNLVAQDTTYYGQDLYGESRLTELLEQLEKIDHLQWIRLLYLYPMYFDNALIDMIAASDRIVPYLDIPLQHINDTVLKRMQRRVSRSDTEALLGKIRKQIDNVVIRTTFITGFPGETDEQCMELVDFVAEQRFERLGVFTYSREEETPAARLDGHVPEDVKEARRSRLMECQQTIAFQYNAAQVGRQLDVLIDRPHPEEPGVWLGRTYADAPDIDGLVFVTAEDLSPGELVACEIVATQEYDLIAVPGEATLTQKR